MSTAATSRTRAELMRGPVLVGAAGLASAAVLYVRDPHDQGAYGYCPFLLLTGRPCPGCGGLRAVNDLVHGDVVAAVSSNALAVIVVGIASVAWMTWVMRRWRGKPAPLASFGERTGYAVLVLILAFAVFRNTPWGSWLAP